MINKLLHQYNNNISTQIMSFNRNLYIFNKLPIFISNSSFQQNSKISKELRLYVNNLINLLVNNNLLECKIISMVCIGGESYLYALSNKYISKIIHYTNSLSIYNDSLMNNNIYKKRINNNLINYNIYQKFKNSDLLIINNAKLNLNLLTCINKRFYDYIIIINCHHLEFWKRIKILSNYKLISRKQFITKDYFVTVNLLKYKYEKPTFISLGNTCAITYQLKKLGLRKEAYPFDWCKINLNQLNNVLKNNFKDFSNIVIKKFSNNHQFYIENNNQNNNITHNYGNGSYILKNSYNILFAHEVINNNNILDFQKKLENRINRFKNLKNSNIIFIVLDINKQLLLIELINNLKKYFNKFKILYINIDNLENNLDSNIYSYDYYNYLEQNNYVKCISINNNTINWGDWKYSNLDWYDIIFNNIY